MERQGGDTGDRDGEKIEKIVIGGMEGMKERGYRGWLNVHTFMDYAQKGGTLIICTSDDDTETVIVVDTMNRCYCSYLWTR